MIRTLVLLCVFALAGCATSPQFHRAPLALPIANQLDVEVRLTQHQIDVAHGNSTAGTAAGLQAAGSPSVAAGGFAAGAAAGLIGALVDVAINAHRKGVADETEKPLREHMDGLNVDELIYQSVDGLDKARFAQTIQAAHLDRAELDDEKQNQLSLGNNILVLVPSYAVSYNQTMFTYELAAKLVDRNKSTDGKLVSSARYHEVFQYIVKEGELPAGAHWNTLSADQWRTLISQAAAETVEMLNYDIGALPSEAAAQSTYGPMRVWFEQSKGDRCWLRTFYGFMSVSTASYNAQGR
jgi:hypothetical protein